MKPPRAKKIFLFSSLVSLGIGIVLIIVAIIFLTKIIPEKTRENILNEKVLGRIDNETYNSLTKEWTKSNYISYTQYYIFNYTNSQSILNEGSKADAIDKGPYSYREIQENEIQAWSIDGNELYFRKKTVYIFEETASCPDCREDDVFIVPDFAFMKVFNTITDKYELYRIICDLPDIGSLLCMFIDANTIEVYIKKYAEEIAILCKAMNVGPFVKVSVKDLLFEGYEEPLFTKVLPIAINFITRFMPDLGEYIPKNISFPRISLNVNNSIGSTYTIKTGMNQRDKIGQILAFSDENISTDGTLLPESWWADSKNTKCRTEIGNLARLINGTTGEFYKPFINKDDKLYIYVPDICRSIPYIFDKEIVVKNVNGYRFIIPPETFDYSIAENCGFCQKIKYDLFSKKAGDYCLPNGLLDISHCKQDQLGIVISNPHFLDTANEVKQLMPRMKPNRNEHQTTIDIEPETGILLNANKRLQINALMNEVHESKSFSIMRAGVYPLLWLNESFLINDENVKQLANELFQPVRRAKIISWIAGIGLGITFILISIILLCTAFWFSKYKWKKENSICNIASKNQSENGNESTIVS